MTLLRVTLLLLLVEFSLGYGAVQNLCNSNSTSKIPLPDADKMIIPVSYKIAGTKTDWDKEAAVLFKELATATERIIRLSGRDGKITYAYNKDQIIALNYTAADKPPTCSLEKEVHPFSVPGQFVAALKLNDSSVAEIINSVLAFAKTQQGEIVSQVAISGVEGVNWVSCLNNADNTTTQIEVVYTGSLAGSVKPASPDFNNPLVLFVRLSQFPNLTAINSTAGISFSVDRYETMSGEGISLKEIPNGVVCSGWVNTNLPLSASNETSAVIRYSEGDKTKTVEVYQLMVGEEPVTKLIFDPVNDQPVPFFGYKLDQVGASEIIHDFKRGYFYALNGYHCAQYGAIPSTSADVSIVKSDVKPKRFNEILLGDLFSGQFGKYGQMKLDDGKFGDIYRSGNTQKQIVEVVVADGEIRMISTYGLESLTPVTITKILRRPGLAQNHPIARGRECLSGQPAKNLTVAFSISGKTLADVHYYGEEEVNFALAKALNQLAVINILRVNTFFINNPDNSLGVTLTVYDKSNKQPANSSSFDFTKEVFTADLYAKLNSTLASGDWHFQVPEPQSSDNRGKMADWSVNKGSMSHYPIVPPIPPTPYEGYSGGSMFVLGLFSLVFGCAIGAGGLFFYTRRQGVSALAYQVFE